MNSLREPGLERRADRPSLRSFDNPAQIDYTFGNVIDNVSNLIYSHMKKQLTTVRIQDVAREAGVSVSTVSRVLNERYGVSSDTVARVQKVIDELGYSSSLAARSMRGATNVIGVIIFNLGLAFNMEVVRGIDQVVQTQGYDLMVYTSNRANHSGDPTWERKVVNQLNGSIIDGVIVVTPTMLSLPTNFPLVTIEPCAEGDYPSVLATNFAGAQEAVQYLIGLGHRRIGMIGGTPRLLSARQRRQGYEAAHHAAGLPLATELYVEGDYSYHIALDAARQLFSLAEPPTAILAGNDESAFAVLEVARELGISVPQQCSVIGFDNTRESRYSSPPLTTVDQSIVGLGSRAAELLIQIIAGQSVENRLYELPTQLIVRESCQPIATIG